MNKLLSKWPGPNGKGCQKTSCRGTTEEEDAYPYQHLPTGNQECIPGLGLVIQVSQLLLGVSGPVARG